MRLWFSERRARLSQQPGSLLSDEETTLMATVRPLEGLRSGSTTIVQSTSNIASAATSMLADRRPHGVR